MTWRLSTVMDRRGKQVSSDGCRCCKAAIWLSRSPKDQRLKRGHGQRRTWWADMRVCLRAGVACVLRSIGEGASSECAGLRPRVDLRAPIGGIEHLEKSLAKAGLGTALIACSPRVH